MCELKDLQSAEIGEIAEALSIAQAEINPAEKNAINPHLKNKYANISAIYDAVREVLPKHGLCVVQTMLPTDGTRAHVRTILAHKSGQWFASECVMPLDRQGGAQGMGSAITYARRYSLSAILGVVADEDDDGNSAQGRNNKAQIEKDRAAAKANNPSPPSDPQMKMFQTLMNQKHKGNRPAILDDLSSYFGRKITSSNELTKSEISEMIEVLNKSREAA
ncbi:ERF family protein [uncultured Desulfovibrio sp.]|uniref:ERF family protein n=1 Tax=uncultured Desulfovibrio sp. TaxID=167968 RepID=UPI0026171ABF|nr:ERF family protein [uncultured Desulfovibrio sp.]